MPKISVIMSVLNGEATIAEAVDSILAQTERDFELILIDDGSTDETPAILDRYDDPRIVRLRHETPQTLPVALNKGLEHATGDFIARMDADDISHPTRFATQLAYFAAHPAVDILGTQVRVRDHVTGLTLKRQYPTTHSMIVWYLFVETALVHPTMMWRRRVLAHRTPLYNNEFRYSQDFELWHYLLGRVRYDNLSDVLLTRRVHRESATRKKSNQWHDKVHQLRADHVGRLVGRTVDYETIMRLYLPRIEGQLLAPDDVQQTIALAIDLFAALRREGLILPDEAAAVQADMIRRVMTLSQQTPQGGAFIGRTLKQLIEVAMPRRVYGYWRKYVLRKA